MSQSQARRVRLSKKHSRTQRNRRRRYLKEAKAAADRGDHSFLLRDLGPPMESSAVLRCEIDELLEVIDALVDLHEARERRLADSEHRRREAERSRP